MTNYQSIPELMRKLPNWVCFRLAKRDGRLTKIPYDPKTGGKAKSNTPATWATFEQAQAAAGKYDGVGFMLTQSPIVGVDIDHCMRDGKPDDYARQMIDRFDSYTEISPSGEGLHILIVGEIADNKGRRNSRVEVYPAGRFLTVTGNIYEGRGELCKRQRELTALVSEIDNGRKRPQKNADEAPRPAAVSLSDGELIGKIRRSKQGAKFSALYDAGDTSAYNGDDSAADIALANILVWWTNGDADRIERLFTASALGQREKWKREDYRRRTIGRALQDWNGQGYTPPPDASTRTPSDIEKSSRPAALEWPIVFVDDNGKVKPDNTDWANVAYLMERLKVSIKKNLLTKEIEISGHHLERLTLSAASTSIRALCRRNGLKINIQDTVGAIERIAEEHQYSPICDYLSACLKAYDGGEYIAPMFLCLELDPASVQDPNLCHSLFVKWLTSAARMAFNTGETQAQGVLVLVGPQGIGKTRFLYSLLPSKHWGAEGVTLDPRDKDSVLRALRFWIVELGEFGGTMRRDRINDLKNFLTQGKDSIRKPYGRAVETTPRRTVYLATVNETRFLKDDTGNRRFWPIRVQKVNPPPEGFKLDQFWGQVMTLAMDEKSAHWLTAEETAALMEAVKPYELPSAEEQALLDSLAWDAPRELWKRRTATELCEKLGLPRNCNRRMGRALRHLAEKGAGIAIPINNHGKWYFVPPYAWMVNQAARDDMDDSGTIAGR